MRAFFADLWALVKPYWKSNERWFSGVLLLLIVGLSLGDVYINVLLNGWNRDFYDSLQNKDTQAFIKSLIRFCYLAFFAIVMGVYNIYLNQMLRIRWRRWLTDNYLSRWLASGNYYRMQVFGNTADNPDQRISDDIGQFLLLTMDLSLGLLSSVVTLVSFLTILWQLSGPLNFALAGHMVHIPGYMLWVALFYALAGTWITSYIGRPLIALNFQQQRFEADFRYSLVRLRENSESVASYKGEAREKDFFSARFNKVVGNYWNIMKRQKKLTWFTSGYQQLATIFPVVVAAPRYFAGKIPLGQLTQTASAFGQVQSSLSYIVNSYTDIASWKAVIARLNGFNAVLGQEQHLQSARLIVHNEDNKIALENAAIHLPDGTILLSDVSLGVKAGESLLITGASGKGKSTVLRTLAGLWPFADGTLIRPGTASILFVPQKGYLPLGTLREALAYPAKPSEIESDWEKLLEQCHLAHLAPLLDEERNWAQTLSPGEQQRIAFARLLITKPAFALLDEATSALDEPTEAYFYNLLKTLQPVLGIISVGHRHTLRAFHDSEKML